MPLIKRIGYFFIGLSLGVVFLTFFFKGKNTEFCYLPNCRVLKNIRNKPIDYSENVKKLMDDKSLTKEQLNSILKVGDVIFSKSDTSSGPCKNYVIESYFNKKPIVLEVTNCTEVAVIEKIENL